MVFCDCKLCIIAFIHVKELVAAVFHTSLRPSNGLAERRSAGLGVIFASAKNFGSLAWLVMGGGGAIWCVLYQIAARAPILP